MATGADRDDPISDLFWYGEHLRADADASNARLIVTDQRVAVERNGRLALAVPFSRLSRVAFDMERGLPASLILVPEEDSTEDPEVLAVPPGQYEAVGRVLGIIGEELVRQT